MRGGQGPLTKSPPFEQTPSPCIRRTSPSACPVSSPCPCTPCISASRPSRISREASIPSQGVVRSGASVGHAALLEAHERPRDDHEDDNAQHDGEPTPVSPHSLCQEDHTIIP